MSGDVGAATREPSRMASRARCMMSSSEASSTRLRPRSLAQ